MDIAGCFLAPLMKNLTWTSDPLNNVDGPSRISPWEGGRPNLFPVMTTSSMSQPNAYSNSDAAGNNTSKLNRGTGNDLSNPLRKFKLVFLGEQSGTL